MRGAGSEQQSAPGCRIDVDVQTLLIVGTQYTLYEIMDPNPIKRGARSEAADGGTVTRSWFIPTVSLLSATCKIGKGGLIRLFGVFNDALHCISS